MNEELTQEDLGIIGRSPAIQDIVATIRRVAPTDLSVLLIGESGVGKEVFAHAIHRLSRRAGKRMIAINCGAIPETLLESELFGHEKGAFTGAAELRRGLFEAADDGTIFMDEIGEMTLATQVKLLRVLETGEYARVGSNEPRHADVRIVAATNRDLDRDVQRGAFRHDLYYRLGSVCIKIPPLRERRADIPALFAHFAKTMSRRLGIPFAGITPTALEILVTYPWPGNIRELKNFTELLLTLEGGTEITEELVLRHLDVSRRAPQENPNAIIHLPGRTSEQAERELIYRALIDLRNEVATLKQMVGHLAGSATLDVPPPPRPQLPAPAPSSDPVDYLAGLNDFDLKDLERKMILAAMRKFRSRRLAAAALGLSDRTLYRKIHEAGLDASDFES